MIRNLWVIMKSPYPAKSSSFSDFLYGLGSGLFVFLFFAVFEPLGFSLLPRAPRRALFIGYGLVTCLAIALNGLLLPRLRPCFFREENWSLGRQIFWMCWVTLTIGLGCYLLSGALCAHYGLPARWVRLQTIVLDTFFIAIFPITVINLANYARLLHRNARIVLEANQRLEHHVAQPEPKKNLSPQVVLLAENNRDTFQVTLADLLFIQAEENYIQVYYKGEKPGRMLLRSSLTRIERQLHPFYPRLFRCHRTCIVNSNQIVNVAGNAQGLKLTLRDTTVSITVARRYVNEFRREVIQNL
ncbi:MAG: LytTR family transcriptional regulator [Acidobacteria bacterium]|nr:LytTR family transcriptional regulator [Acidobacteriota bacterium]MBU4306660.1 LytTR family transcriptional regulator [Acidobacteriota bacterium]MBU4405761.1 LytTR family transcriptional regulator [Acidobacteriota bacterium]MCG2811358.1 LytTR family transcriptional regulator [Candidatus Aminicenantes bacterium]